MREALLLDIRRPETVGWLDGWIDFRVQGLSALLRSGSRAVGNLQSVPVWRLMVTGEVLGVKVTDGRYIFCVST